MRTSNYAINVVGEKRWGKEEVAPLSFVLNMNCSALFALGAQSVGELLKKPLFRDRARARARAGVMALASASDASDAVYEQKRALRWRVRRELKSLDPVQRKQQDEAVQKLVLESAWFKSSTSLCAYISCESLREVDTSKIISCILHNPHPIPKKLYVPRVEDKESNMRMLHISSIAELMSNSMNILEPTPLDNNGNQREDVMQADKPVDLLLLPGLAFDCSGRRLGRGGGYYDNFIKTYLELAAKRGWQPPLLVALAYSTQILDAAIPVSAHDVPVDAIVSPSGVIPISPNAVERM